MFPDSIKESIFTLRDIYRGKKTCTIMSYPIIEIIKYSDKKEISIKLFYYPGTNTLEIQPLDSIYSNRVSFYDYSKPERRWVRNKRVIFSLICDLKKCDLWDLISNKDFLIVNNNNTLAEKTNRSKTLKKFLS